MARAIWAVAIGLVVLFVVCFGRGVLQESVNVAATWHDLGNGGVTK